MKDDPYAEYYDKYERGKFCLNCNEPVGHDAEGKPLAIEGIGVVCRDCFEYIEGEG